MAVRLQRNGLLVPGDYQLRQRVDRHLLEQLETPMKSCVADRAEALANYAES